MERELLHPDVVLAEALRKAVAGKLIPGVVPFPVIADKIHHLSHERQRRRSYYADLGVSGLGGRLKPSAISAELKDWYELKREVRAKVEAEYGLAKENWLRYNVSTG